MNEKQKSFRNQPGLRDLEFHKRNCIICKHPYRAAIEEDFIHWHSPEDIGCDFKVNYRSVYRHPHATGLYERRRQNLRCVLETFLERAEHVRVSAKEIISAVRTYARITKDGEWVEPPTTNKIMVDRTGGQGKRALAAAQTDETAPPAPQLISSEDSNGTHEILSEQSVPPVSVVLATTDSDGNSTQPVNQFQTEIDVTDSK